MRACVCALFAAICTVSSVPVLRRDPQIQTNILEELPPLFIPCNLTDIVTISAPLQYNNDTLYYLYSPNNDVTKLDITMPIKQKYENAMTHGTTQHLKNINNSFIPNESNATYIVRNVNYRQEINSTTKDVFVDRSNEFAIGPVGEEDHGNWVLSAYYKKNGSWVEMFQVITIQITEHIPVWCSPTSLQLGGSLQLGFVYPLPDIETCELIVPTPANQPFGSYFREYSRTSLPTCSYVVPNLTIQDAGRWTIIGVGKIIYEGRIFVELHNKELINNFNAPISRSERNKFLKLLMVPMLGHILKAYYQY